VSAGTARVERDRRGRRVRERDRHGTVVATLAWRDDGRLAEAEVRLADGAWLRVEPGAGHDPRWGRSDVVQHAGVALTHFAAVDWAAVSTIPPLAEPARLPPGGGTAILNLVAALAADQRGAPLAYHGPYPTEQLFLALLESFRFELPGPDVVGEAHPLERFMAGQLAWRAAPHARDFDPRGVYVQARERVEKVVWRGRAYYRPDWQGVERQATHRVRDADGRVRCSLWALGTALEDHLVLAADGVVLEVHAPAADDETPRALPAAIVRGVVAVVAAASAAPLAASIRAVAGALAFEWAPLAGDIATVDGPRARVGTRLLRALAARLGDVGDRAGQVRLGFAALVEMAHALGDALRARAQARLAAAPVATQAEALNRTAAASAAAEARAIGEAVERLLDEAAQLLA
jgi:hypothetical protein